ncbi:MAG: Ig-like domain-containing protein [Lachnospiraceae bacterium]|nr:Ig-like domain-containing protein [Lachnospiraceae bacterium]
MNRKFVTRILAGVFSAIMVLTSLPAGAIASYADEIEEEASSVEEAIEIDEDSSVALKAVDETVDEIDTSEEEVIEDVSDESLNAGLTIEAATGSFGEAFGNMTAEAIQKDIVVGDDAISGTLKQVTGWDEFGANLSSGHYIALHIDDSNAISIMAGIGETAEENWRLKDITDDPDRVVILRVKDKDIQSIKVVVKYSEKVQVERVFALTDLELEGFAATATFDENEQDLLGKSPSDLQCDMVIDSTSISGSLNYVYDYTGFSSILNEQHGNYLALDVDIPYGQKLEYGTKADALYTTSKTAAETGDLLDRELIIIVKDTTKPLILKVTYDDGSVETRKYDISGLVLTEGSDLIEVTTPEEKSFGEAFGDLKPSNLQSNIVITEPEEAGGAGTITGTLKQIHGFTGFSSPLSSGHYLSVKADAPGAKSIKVSTDSDDAVVAELISDPDKTAIIRIKDKDTQKLLVKVTYVDGTEVTRKYDLTGLELEGFAATATFGENEQDLLGKSPSDLQSGMVIDSTSISGSLNYVHGYTGFSSILDEQYGNYLALNVDIPYGQKLEYGTNSASLYTTSSTAAELENHLLDRELIIIVKNTENPLILKVTYEDGSVETRKYDISGLDLAQDTSAYDVTLSGKEYGANLGKLIKAGTTGTITVEAVVTDRATQKAASGRTITWASSDETIATVVGTTAKTNADGIATATVTVKDVDRACIAVISATVADGESVGTTRFEIYKKATDPNLVIDMALPEEYEAALEPTIILPAGTNYRVKWEKTSDNDVADVDEDFGIVWAKQRGSETFAQVVYESDGKTVAVKTDDNAYTVNVITALSRVSIISQKDVFANNYPNCEALSLQFEPEGNWESVFDNPIVWSSSNTAVATVDEYGAVTGISKGATTIKAVVSVDGKQYTASIALKVRSAVTKLTVGYADFRASSEDIEMQRFPITEIGRDVKFWSDAEGSDDADKRVSWSSSNPFVAKITEDGYLTALKKGTAYIVASTPDGKSAGFEVEVIDCSGIVVSAQPMTVVVAEGADANAVVNLLYNDENLSADTYLSDYQQLFVSSSDETIATAAFNSAGNMTIRGLKSGEATLTVSYKVNNVEYGNTQIKVKVGGESAPVTDLKATVTEATLNPGDSYTFAYTTVPESFTDTVLSWSSDTPAVAAVDTVTGKIDAFTAGTATITLTAKKGNAVLKELAFSVTVKELPYAKTASISPENVTLLAPYSNHPGESVTLKASLYPYPCKTLDHYVWVSSNTDVVGINEFGLEAEIYAKKPGTATITFTNIDGSSANATDSITVNVVQTVADEDYWTGRFNEDGPWIGFIDEYVYTGSAIKPTPNVYYGKVLLTAGRDYTYSYLNNVNAAIHKNKPTVVVTLKGNFAGKLSQEFVISPAGLWDDGIVVNNVSAVAKINKRTKVYVEQFLTPTITFNGKTLKAGTDFEAFYYDDYEGAYAAPNDLQGSDGHGYSIEIKGIGNFKDETYAEEFLTDSSGSVKAAKLKVELAFADGVKGPKKNQAYYQGGDEIIPEVTVKNGSVALTEDQYQVTISNNKNLGTATVTVTGMAPYYGQKKTTFKIVPMTVDLSKAGADLEILVNGETSAEIPYAKGGAKPESVEVSYKDVPLTSGVDYTYSVKVDNKKSIGTVTIKGKGSFFKKSTKTTYKIVTQSIENMNFVVDDFVANAKTKANAYKKNKITVIDLDGKALKAKTDYTVTFEPASGLPAVGDEVTAIITGKGKYEGTAYETFRIVEASQSLKKAKYSFKVNDEEIAASKYYVKYKGVPVVLDKEDLVIKVNRKVGRTNHWVVLDDDDYEIVSYAKNNKVGISTITIRGTGEYAGLLTLKVKIKK